MLIRASEDHQTRLPIPHEPDDWLVLRRLTWSQWERAGQVATQDQARRGGLAETHDTRTVLECGIVAWSYREPVSPDSIGLLDPVTAAWAYAAILRFNGLGSADPLLEQRLMTYHRWLDGDPGAPEPELWQISRICEEFGCTPSVAMAEPLATCMEITQMRAYIRAYQAVEQAKDAGDVPGAMAELVRRNRERLNRDRLRRQAGAWEATDGIPRS